MTPNDFSQKVNELTQRYEQGFPALLLAVSSMQVKIAERVFDKSINTAGIDMAAIPYSLKPIYVQTDTLPNTPSAFQVGKRGTKIKSAYFPQGYGQLKKAVNRPVLELNLILRNDWLNPSIIQTGNSVSVSLKEEINAKKNEGLEKKYGQFLKANQEEIDFLIEVLQFELTNDFNNL
jgi:hypothetical protein